LLGTRLKLAAAVLSISTVAATVGVGLAGASDGGTGGSRQHDRKGYVNPFKPARWYEGRIDMGVDYVPARNHAVVAIGHAKILGSDSHSGWPGGHLLWYKLLDGDHAGTVIYVAEELKKLVPKGTRVQAGQRIATARAGGSGLEIGWANRRGIPRAASCYAEGMKTHSGREMGRFLHSLGAKVGDRPGRVPDHPVGKRC
jgi:murein DD-endopeptidase MepM/ murein hydrolase activator NlpD